MKQLLLKDKDQLARACREALDLLHRRRPSETDRDEIEAIVRKVREKKYGFRSLIHEVVQSKVFQTK